MNRSILLLVALAGPSLAAPTGLTSLALWRDRIVSLDARSALRAWDAQTLEPDAKLVKKLRAQKPTALAAEGDALYATDGAQVWRWSAEREAWEAPQPVTSSSGKLQRFVAGPRGAVLIFEGGVFDVRGARWYPRQEPALQVLSAKVFPDQLWIGTQDAAGVGRLLVLDFERGSWSEQVDDLRCPTGISEGLTGTVVSWSKADTQLVVHGLDGSAAGTLLRRDRAALHDVTFNRYDRKLYGVDQRRLVRISRGGFEPVAELGAGVSDLKVLGADSFALGSADGGVVLVREGRVQTLAAK